jgi:hypothetical protein
MAKSLTASLRDRSTLFVDASLMLRATRFSAKNDVRYYLNAVCVQPSKSGGVLVMGCDGHVALVLHDPNGKADKPYILPFAKGRHDKALSARDAAHVVITDTGSIQVVDQHGVIRFINPEVVIEAKYPDVVAAFGEMSQYQPGLLGSFNPELLQRAIDSAGKGRYADIKFYRRENDSQAAMFTTRGGFGLVMPMRDDGPLTNRITRDFGGTQ